MATDDESVVRRTVRRYLLAQRVQVITCAVDVSDNRATADCESTPDSSSEPGQPGRMFALERSNDAWAIRSIELKIAAIPSPARWGGLILAVRPRTTPQSFRA
jgi:hypothetical protein